MLVMKGPDPNSESATSISRRSDSAAGGLDTSKAAELGLAFGPRAANTNGARAGPQGTVLHVWVTGTVPVRAVIIYKVAGP